MNGIFPKWILKAVFLGVVFFLSVLIIKPIGVSTQYAVIGGIIHNAIDPSIISEDSSRKSGYRSTNAYYDKKEGALAAEIKHPLNYSMIFLYAIPLGAFFAWTLDKGRKKKILEGGSRKKTPQGFVQRWYIREFAGGFLFLFGARMADGCTSGHMMSGMMQGSLSGYVFALCVFAVAVPTAKALKKFG